MGVRSLWTTAPPPPPRLLSRSPYPSTEPVAFTPNQYTWNDAPWIGWDEDMAELGPARWLRRHAPDAAIVLSTSLFFSQLAAARAGVGVVLAPAPYLGPSGLTSVKLHRDLAGSLETLPVDRLWLVCHRAQRDVPRIAAVWTFLAETMRQRMMGGDAARR